MSERTILIKGKRHKNLKYIEIDGETYVQDIDMEKNKRSVNEAETTIVFRKVNVKEYEKTVDSLAEKISTKTNVKEIIKQALYDIAWQDIMKVKKELEKEKPYFRNNRGCVSISVGKTIIPIRN